MKKIEEISMEDLMIDFFWDNIWFFELIFVLLFFGSFFIFGLIWVGEGRAIIKILKDPYSHQKNIIDYQIPSNSDKKYQTFCGT